MHAGLPKSMYLLRGQRLYELSVIDEFIRGLGVLWGNTIRDVL